MCGKAGITAFYLPFDARGAEKFCLKTTFNAAIEIYIGYNWATWG